MKLKSAQIRNATFHVCERPELFREGLVAVVNWRNRIRLSDVAIFMIVNAFMYGQSTLATLRRSARDAAGAAIVHATVTVRNADTQVSREARTDEAGVYILFDLPPSRYEFTVATPGFAIQRRTDIELTVNAATTESSVEVHAEGHGIDVESAALTRVVDLNGPGLDSACAVGARRLGHSYSECTERNQLQARKPPVWFSRDQLAEPSWAKQLLAQPERHKALPNLVTTILAGGSCGLIRETSL